MTQRVIEPHSQWQNLTELQGGIVKRRVKNRTRATNTPIGLWNYYWEYESAIRSLTPTSHIANDGATSSEKIHGYTTNISEYLQHKRFAWVYVNDLDDPETQRLGRWLGPAHSVSQGMPFRVLANKDKVVIRSKVNSLEPKEIENEEVKIRQADFTKSMEAIM